MQRREAIILNLGVCLGSLKKYLTVAEGINFISTSH